MLNERDKIKHLYNRAGFGLSVNDWQTKSDWKKSLDVLFKSPSNYHSLQTISLAEVEATKAKMRTMRKEDVKDLKKFLKQNVSELNNLWLQEMIDGEAQLQEKMALFWHGHFACRSLNPYFDQQYLDIIRKNSLGNFSVLLNEISKTPAMLQFLNNQQNKKDHPNENFARELMELFTIGRGNYTEQDVKEAARAFTGYGFDKTGEFKFRIQQHDFGTKIFFGKSGSFTGDDILQIILKKNECAYFITKKIYRFFVNDNPDETIVKQLAKHFYESNYDIKGLLKEIFSSDWFYDEMNIAAKIKSPIELLVGLSRTIPIDFENEQSPLFIQRSLGQVLLNPPNVAGWPGGRNWIDSSSLLLRMRLPQVIYYDEELDFSPKEDMPEQGMMRLKMTDEFIKRFVQKKLAAKPDWMKALQYFSSSANIMDDIVKMLLAKPCAASARKCIQNNRDTSSKESEIKSVMIEVMSLPDYQLC